MKFLLGYKMKIVGGEIFPEWGMSNFMVNEGGMPHSPVGKTLLLHWIGKKTFCFNRERKSVIFYKTNYWANNLYMESVTPNWIFLQ